jgi:hypothetical protein
LAIFATEGKAMMAAFSGVYPILNTFYDKTGQLDPELTCQTHFVISTAESKF